MFYNGSKLLCRNQTTSSDIRNLKYILNINFINNKKLLKNLFP